MFFLGQFLLCSDINLITKNFKTLVDVVTDYLAQTDADTFFWNLFSNLVVLCFDLVSSNKVG